MSSKLHAGFTVELSNAGRRMRKLFDAHVRERGLTLPRARTLLLLAQDRSWNQRELADALEIEHPSVVRLLDGLERQGLITRTEVEGDRRAKQISLTDIARAQVAELELLTARIRSELLDGIPQEDIATALRVLQRLGENGDARLQAARKPMGQGDESL